VSNDITGTITTRIAQLTKERDEFIVQANAKIAAINGGIAELERLIKEIDEPEDD